MTVLIHMLEQQREFYKEMLTHHEENFIECFIEVIMEGANKRLDGIIIDVQELKSSLDFTQGKMEEMKSTHTELKPTEIC